VCVCVCVCLCLCVCVCVCACVSEGVRVCLIVAPQSHSSLFSLATRLLAHALSVQVNLDCKLNLQQIAVQARNAEFRPTRFAAVRFRLCCDVHPIHCALCAFAYHVLFACVRAALGVRCSRPPLSWLDWHLHVCMAGHHAPSRPSNNSTDLRLWEDGVHRR
jgi:hypothetical protein